jgi:hypothetical protein
MRHVRFTTGKIIRLFSSIILVALVCNYLCAQPEKVITIRLVDSKTGSPVIQDNLKLQVWINHNTRDHGISLQQDKTGEASLAITEEMRSILILVPQAKDGWCLVNCDSVKDHPYVAHWYSVADILKSGVVEPNHCNNRKTVAKPGEIVIFIRPPTFWEKFQI